MKVAEIEAALNPLDILLGVNLYPDEPSSGCHYVSIMKDTHDKAIAAIKAAGGEAMRVPGLAEYPWSSCIQVRRQ